jgi:hypothetical protein
MDSAAMIRIAMWSGPRNISTAMMRSWGSRADTFVTDEPFYAHYLTQVDVDHPGKAEVLASQDQQWQPVAEWLTEAEPDGKQIWYQKHMAQHYLPQMQGPWFAQLRHAFLLRDPRAVVASFSKVVTEPELKDTGFPQLLDLYRRAADLTGSAPAVVDSAAILKNPKAMLQQLCERLDVPFDEAMLSWAPGPRDTDGVWAKYWYHAVEGSTGFQPYQERQIELPARLERVYEECIPYYEELSAFQITVPEGSGAVH